MIDDLQFGAPHRLWLLAAAVVLLAAYVATLVVRRQRAKRFATSSMLGRLTAGGAGAWRHGLSLLFVAALVLAAVGAAQPTVPGQQERKQATVVVAIDVSDSMGAADVAPTRIAAAVSAARAFVRDLPATFDVGLVTAGASPTVLVSPTLDHGQVLDALGTLRLGPGTALGDAIFTSLSVLPPPTSTSTGERAARIVLLSDGVTTTGRPDQEAIAAATLAGVPVSTIAFGTANASVTSQDQLVQVPVDSSALRAIADGTGGSFFQAATSSQLSTIYDQVDAEVTVYEGRRDVAEWFAGGAVVALVLALSLSMMGTSRAVWA